MIRTLMAGVAIALACTTPSQAGQSRGRGHAEKSAVASPPTASVRVGVRDQDGTSLSEVRILLSGPATGEFVTGGAGTAIIPNLKDGMYRLRCERQGFITLEREFAVHGGAYSQVDVVLNPAPPPPPPPKPAPVPPPAEIHPGGPPVTMSIVDFLDRNLIGREPLKESILACNPLETVRLLQMREGVATHVHEHGDEVIYVIAGEGAVRIGTEAVPVRAGSLVIVTSGNGHGFERRGKTPLIVVSTLAGAACDPVRTTRD